MAKKVNGAESTPRRGEPVIILQFVNNKEELFDKNLHAVVDTDDFHEKLMVLLSAVNLQPNTFKGSDAVIIRADEEYLALTFNKLLLFKFI
jgi:hypothetical protein